MSTKTLRKRIALVAVSALGAGMLSLVAIPAANAAVDAHVAGTFPGATADATKSYSEVIASFTTFCADTTSATSAADSIVIPVGAQVTTTFANTKIVGVTGSSLAINSLTNATSAISAGGRLQLTGTGAASATLNAVAAGSASLIYAAGTTSDIVSSASNTLYITVVAACTSATYSATYSDVSTASGSTDSAWPNTNVDEQTAVSAGGSLYIRLKVKNEYGNYITTGTYGASATNGALVALGGTIGTAPSKGTTSFVSGTDADGQLEVRVNPASSSAGGTTTVTVSLNGTTIATKTLTFYGEAKKIVIGAVKSGKTGTTASAGTNTGTGFFTYTYQDAAGNAVPGGAAAFVATTASATIPTAVNVKSPDPITAATPGGTGLVAAINTAIGSTTVGVMGFDCGATAGSATFTIYYVNDITGDTLTAPVTASCAGGIDTYTVSTDKASYNIGEIATITITAKDSKGNPVADSTVMTVDTVSVGGGSLTKAVAATDAFSAGVRTYKAQMTTAGTFNTVVSLTGTTTTSATTSYKVVDPSASSVTNEEVLASIVKLIASINKQIAALQKLLTKKK